jgi:hypothetical protein
VLLWRDNVHAAFNHRALGCPIKLHPESWKVRCHSASAFTQVGLKLMQDDGKVFSCYTNMWDTIFYSELGRCRPSLLQTVAQYSHMQGAWLCS